MFWSTFSAWLAESQQIILDQCQTITSRLSVLVDQFVIFYRKSIPGWGVTNVGGTAADFPAKLLEVEVRFCRQWMLDRQFYLGTFVFPTESEQ